MSNISKLSIKLALLFKVLMILYPTMVILMWSGMLNIPFGYTAFSRLPIQVDFDALDAGIKISACLVQMIPALVLTLGFYYLVQLFNLYSKNIIFARENIKLIRKIGYTLILQAIAYIISQPLLSLILTIDAPPGQHALVLSFGSYEITNLCVGTVVILISIIMGEGHKLEEDKSFTI